MQFFKNVISSCLGVLLAFIAFFVILILIAVGIGNSINGSDSKTIVMDNSVLMLKLNAPIREMEIDDPIMQLLPGAGDQEIGLIQLRNAISHAQDDGNIKGIFLNVSSVHGGFSTITEVRESIVNFRKTGKWVVAYSDNYSEGAYYLASAADKVYLNPEGELEFNGIAIELTFFKKLFDKLDIKPEIFRVGDFKSAVEPYLRENASEPNKLQLNSLIQALHGEMLEGVSGSRKIPKEKLREIANKMLVRNAKDALSFGLVDALFYEDQVRDELRERLGLKKDKSISFVGYSKYKKSYTVDTESSNEIAVIVAEGTILPGESNKETVGGATIVEALRKARTRDHVKAIVLRINSPGGSFQASDEMWREVKLAAAEKPVIASMGDYAASGGYYLAMAADTIVAQPTTITGSIGIFSMLFDLSGFLGDKIGITSEELKTGEIGNMMSVMRPLTEQEKAIWQTKTNEIYEVFTGKAAQGRAMAQDDIKKIASGRVWTGAQAKDNGLVDILGNFQDAINIAAKAAKVEGDYELHYYPHQKTFLENLTGDAQDEARVYMLKKELGENYIWFREWEKVKASGGTQAKLQWEVQNTEW